MKDLRFMNVTLPRVLSSYAVVMFAVLWFGFVIAVVSRRPWLDLIWDGAGMLPLMLQIIVWLLFLPAADRAMDLEIRLVNAGESAGAGRHAGLDVCSHIRLFENVVSTGGGNNAIRVMR